MCLLSFADCQSDDTQTLHQLQRFTNATYAPPCLQPPYNHLSLARVELTTLTELTFDRCIWRRCAGEALGPALGCLTLLQRLTIRAQLGSEGAIVLAPFIGRLHNLRVLCLPSTGMCICPGRSCARGVAVLSRHITNLSHLQELDLKSAYVSEGIGPLSIVLGSFIGLTLLDIGDGFISDIGARALASGHLSGLTRLQTLGLRSNALGPMGFRCWCRRLPTR